MGEQILVMDRQHVTGDISLAHHITASSQVLQDHGLCGILAVYDPSDISNRSVLCDHQDREVYY